VFTLTQAFGNEPNNGTRLPYFRAGPDDWWDEDPNSAHYNRHVISRHSPGVNSENLYYSGAVYAHAVVINYNVNPVVKGAGSGFFLHVSDGAPTQGCVAIDANQLNVVMRWLRPSMDPVISIGVGAQALALVRPAQ
jgi:L,D-peptidoglycan transpeptidase YkuD (ErfK/YbiS/YcfS/YnhG family)